MKHLYLIAISLILSAGAAFAQKTDTSKTMAVTSVVETDMVFTTAQVPPQFPGGFPALQTFLSRHVVYPAVAYENGTHGYVIVNFIVEKDGSLSAIKVVKGIGDQCDEEAARVIKTSPRWSPGVQDGKAVRTYYTVPVSFNF